MASNMRIVPESGHSRSIQATTSAPSAPGLPDTMRSKPGTSSDLAASAVVEASMSPHTYEGGANATSGHPLEARLAAWRATQHRLKMEGLRRQFGVAEPVKRGMELATVRGGEWRPAALGGSAGVHGDVLENRDTSVEWDDVYGRPADDPTRGEVPGMHAEMEQRLKMGQL